ncbi:MAG: serine/threonine protein kinase, partial [Planctomycetota bacterium]
MVGQCEYQLVKEGDDLELNELLSKYEIEQLVGEGGMGIVFKARQRSMDRLVALKILSPRHAKRQDFIDQFIEEARAVGSLSHPNLIQVHEVDTENQVHYFSMEFVDGPTCSGLLKSQQRLDPPIVLEVGRQTAKALAYAHSQRLIHRDIKPENLMLTSDNVIKVADLGISKTTEQLAESEPDEVVGTPHYMAPEAGRGGSIDTRYDIYSLGATLFHLLTGSPPYSGSDGAAIIRAHINQPIPDVRDLAPDTPAALAELITSMLAKDPEQRPQDASELAQRFEALSLELGYISQSGDDGTLLLRQLASIPVPAERRPKTDPDRASTNRTATRTPRHKQGLLPKLLILLFLGVIGLIAYRVINGRTSERMEAANPGGGTTAPLFQLPDTTNDEADTATTENATNQMDR